MSETIKETIKENRQQRRARTRKKHSNVFCKKYKSRRTLAKSMQDLSLGIGILKRKHFESKGFGVAPVKTL